MKIAIPINEKDIKTEVSKSFGRAPYYVIYESTSKNTDFIVNTAAISPGGAGIKAAQLLADNGVNIVITPRQGENAAAALSAAGIKAVKSLPMSAEENIKAYLDGKLTDLADVHKGFHAKS